MGSVQQIRVKWNNHQSNFPKVFDNLLHKSDFVDVTLSCEGHSLKAHKLVLSACSPYFHNLFVENPCKHPIVIMRDFRYAEIEAVVEYMYKGEVNISRDSLREFLRTAQSLQVKGLADDDACDTNDGADGDNSSYSQTDSQLPQPSISRQAVEQTSLTRETYSQPQTVYSQSTPKRDAISHSIPAKRMKIAEKPPPPQPPAPPIDPPPAPVTYQPISNQATDTAQSSTDMTETQIKTEVKQQYDDDNQDSNMDETQEPDQIGPESPESDTIVLGDDPEVIDDEPEVMFSHDASQENLSASLMMALRDTGAGPSTSSPQQATGEGTGQKRSKVWKYFKEIAPSDPKAMCLICGTLVCRSRSRKRYFSTSHLREHLNRYHSEMVEL